MALTDCKECGREISSSARDCPHCGAPRKKRSHPLRLGLLLFVLLGLLWFVWMPPSCKGAFRKVAPGLTPDPMTRYEKTITIAEDQYQRVSYASKGGEIRVSVRVATGPAVDVYFIDEADLPKFPKKRFTYYPKLSQEKTRGFSGSARVAPGRYVLIVDNTDYGGARPPMNMRNDRAVVEVKIEAD